VIGLVLAVCGSAGAVAVALRGFARVRRAAPPGDERLRSVLAAQDDEALTRVLIDALPEHGADIAEAAVAGAARIGVQLLNEALADLDRDLRVGLELGRPAARIAFAVGTLGAVLEAIAGLSGEAPASWMFGVPAFLLGAAGAVVCFEVNRRSGAKADEARAGWDRFAAEVGRKLTRTPP